MTKCQRCGGLVDAHYGGIHPAQGDCIEILRRRLEKETAGSSELAAPHRPTHEDGSKRRHRTG
jgi:hypothetical protein